MKTRKVFIIGLDGFDLQLATELARDGVMPRFDELIKTSALATTRNPEGFEAGASWLDFYYGCSVGTHGQFDGMQTLDKNSYRKRLLSHDELVVDPFWRLASSLGRRVAVIDAPYALLEPEINGIQVTDWLVHVFRTADINTNPPALGRKIIGQYGDSPFDRRKGCPTNKEPVDTVEQVVALRDKLVTRIKQKTAYCLDAIHSEPWDLFFCVYHDAHDVGHMGWHLHDPGHPRYEAELVEKAGNPVRDVYAALDSAIGKLLDAIPDDAVTLLYSNIGMGREISATGFLDVILKRLESSYQLDGSEHLGDRKTSGQAAGEQSFLSKVNATLLPEWARNTLHQSGFMIRRYERHHTKSLRKRRFMELAANHATGGIRINLLGRENYGVVEKGTEYQALCERLISDISGIRNSETGQPLVDQIKRTSDIHRGAMVENLPDVIMKWNRSGPIRHVHSERTGELTNEINRSRSGDHVNNDGFLLAKMPNMAPVEINRPIRAVGIAPTILSLLDVPNKISEGRLIDELVSYATW